jgi:hypothetical protein
VLALLLGGPDHDGVGSKKDRQERRCHAEIQPSHILGNAIDVVGGTAKTAQLLGDEQQV